MKTRINSLNLLFIAFLLTCFMSCSDDMEAWEMELEQAKAATASFINIDAALGDGRIDVSGYVPNMGHHYLNPVLADGTFELLKPEFILYVPDANGTMKMVAIEYGIVPEDPENPGNPPEGFTGDEDKWHFNEMIGMWTLHVWTQMENPDGIFAAQNPAIGD